MTPTIQSLESRRLLATFTVTTNADSGVGSLRNAITQANATTAADVINFNITSASKTITFASALPIVSQPLTIDATTQPGYVSAPVVRLSNPFTENLYIDAAGSTVRGLSLTDSDNGIVVNKANVTIEKCYIGLEPSGVAAGNYLDGVVATASANFLSLKNNVISSNGANGVNLSADNAYIVGNFVGLDPTGTAPRGNGQNGMRVSGGDNLTIGDVGDVNRNIFSANQIGIRYVSASTGGIVINNYFGTDRTGNVDFHNLGGGIAGVTVTNLTIGVPTLGNRFASNAVDLGTNSSSNIVAENVIGVGVDPSVDLGGSLGIYLGGVLNEVTNNVIGYTSTGIRIEGSNDTISGNRVGVLPSGQAAGCETGLWIPNGSSNQVRGNTFANCTVLGVQLNAGTNNSFENATWANGRSYLIEGIANDGLTKPVIQSVVENANGSYTINVAYLGMPAGNYQVALYSSDQAGNALSGHTQRLLQTATFISTGGNASRSYTVTGKPLDAKYITATLTETPTVNTFGSTTEPSIAVLAHGTPGMAGSSFEFETKHTVRFDFTSVTQSSVSIGDLVLRNRDTLVTYAPETMTVSGNTYRWNRTSPLPDGRYEAIIPAGAVSNAYGVSKADMKLTFHVLAGDANRDGTVNFDDLLVISQNYGTTGKTFSQGNFNYDAGGNVNFDDLLIVSQRYGTSLFSESPIASLVSTSRKTRAVRAISV